MVLFVNLPIPRYDACSIHPATVRTNGGVCCMLIAQTSLLSDGLPCWSGQKKNCRLEPEAPAGSWWVNTLFNPSNRGILKPK